MATYLICSADVAPSFTADSSTPLLLHPPRNHRQRSQAMDMDPTNTSSALYNPSDHSPSHRSSPSSAFSPSSPFSSVVSSIPSIPGTGSLPPAAFPPPRPLVLTPSTRWLDVWPGHHIFLCGGHCIVGSNPFLFLFTLFLTLSTSTLYLLFVAPHYSLFFSLPLMPLLPLTILSFLFAALSDPGIVPPILSPTVQVLPPPPPSLSPSSSSPSSSHSALTLSGVSRPYCPFCRLYRPLRAKHCKYCHVCVEEFDHHCPYIGQCVGRRNYRYYLTYITTLTLLTPYMATLSLFHVYQLSTTSSFHFLSLDPLMSSSLGGFFSLTFLFALSLSSYHLHLLWLGSTTNEEVRGVWKGKVRVFDRGCIGNVRRVMWENGGGGGNGMGYVGEKVEGEERMETEELRRWEEGERRRREREEADISKAAQWRRKRKPLTTPTAGQDNRGGGRGGGENNGGALEQNLLPHGVP